MSDVTNLVALAERYVGAGWAWWLFLLAAFTFVAVCLKTIWAVLDPAAQFCIRALRTLQRRLVRAVRPLATLQIRSPVTVDTGRETGGALRSMNVPASAERLRADLAAQRAVVAEHVAQLESIIGPKPALVADAGHVQLEDASIASSGGPDEVSPPLWRLNVRKNGAPARLAVYVQELEGTSHREDGYFAPWRLSEDRYVPVGKVAQTVNIAQMSNSMNELIRAAMRERTNSAANALDFFSPSAKPNGFFTRQVMLDGSLRMRLVALDETGKVHADSIFELRLDTRGPRMVPVR